MSHTCYSRKHDKCRQPFSWLPALYIYIYYIYPLICDAMSPYKYFPSIADIDTFSLRIDSATLDVMGIV